ncbi:MAG: hypothetical protein U1D55_10740 [Phycisphaerae bacterium]
MSTIRAHFDGRVFVPEEPVDCPAGTALRLIVISPQDERARPLVELAQLAASFPDDPAWPADGAAETDHFLYGTPKRGR